MQPPRFPQFIGTMLVIHINGCLLILEAGPGIDEFIVFAELGSRLIINHVTSSTTQPSETIHAIRHSPT